MVALRALPSRTDRAKRVRLTFTPKIIEGSQLTPIGS
jgi:hypothetical protein